MGGLLTAAALAHHPCPNDPRTSRTASSLPKDNEAYFEWGKEEPRMAGTISTTDAARSLLVRGSSHSQDRMQKWWRRWGQACVCRVPLCWLHICFKVFTNASYIDLC